MTKNIVDIWKKIRVWLSESTIMDSSIYNEYFAFAKFDFIGNENDYAIIAQTEYAKTVLTSFETSIKEKLIEFFGEYITVEFLTEKEYELRKQIANNQINNNGEEDFESSFENFVSGSTNSSALAACKTVAKQLGQSWNPLFIYGPTGTGKTHLLRAIEHSVLINYKNKKVRYIDAETFGNAVVEIINRGFKAIDEFINNTFGSYDALLVDDIQLIAKREKTNEILFKIFNNFINENKQIVLTSDKYPEELSGFEERLISRFQSGLTVGIEPPDYETAMSIINKYLFNQGIEEIVSAEVRKYMAQNLSSDIRKIKGFIINLQFWNIQNNFDRRVIMLDDIQEIIKDRPLSNFGKLNPRRIKEYIAEKYDIDVKTMESKSRVKTIVKPRNIAMYLMKKMLNFPLDRVGSEFNGRDHSTVINSINNVENEIKKNNSFKRQIAQYEKDLSRS